MGKKVFGDFEGFDTLRQYHVYIRKYPLIDRKKEIELSRRISRGDKVALNELICANLRLVVKIAYDFIDLGLPILDLIQSGNLGLMKAAARFDGKKAKFSTYASWWIKQSIRRELADKGRNIRIPVHKIELFFKINRVRMRLEKVYGREPTFDEIANEMGLEKRLVTSTLTACQHTLSLNQPIDGNESDIDGPTTLGDVVPDPSAIHPDVHAVNMSTLMQLRTILMKLSPRERKIITGRFNLDDNGLRTLESLGCEFKITRERVRQLEAIALKKLLKHFRK